MLNLVRIPAAKERIKEYPHEFSGGMQQRAMIAISLSCRPKLLIADEPTTNLDVTIQAQILRLIKRLRTDIGMAVLMITHDLGVIPEMCDRVGVMYCGEIIELAKIEDLFQNPKHPYTQGLLASIPKITEKVEFLEIIPGSVPNLISPPTGCKFHPRCKYAMPICSREPPEHFDIEPDHTAACYLVPKEGN
jgi:oligopeptide/dipeptide ABC transporter ATP-binding protein